MAYGQIDPARLDGDALTRWYLRSPADIEQERQADAAQRYSDLFGDAGQPADEPDNRQADQSLADPDPAQSGQGGLRAVDYGGGLDDGVYRPSRANAQVTPTADTVWNCPTCHGRLPLPVPLLPPPLQPLQPFLRDIPPSSGGASGRQWSDKPQCDQQFEADREICQKAKSYQCWENQNKRLAHCSPTGEVGIPKLGFGPRGR
jgi:hypothetical protein